jgi:F0F1-type ATP synthase epsilon subunit
VTVLADAALERDEIDIAAARADLQAAQDEHKAAGGDLDAQRRAQAKIDFAQTRLTVAQV